MAKKSKKSKKKSALIAIAAVVIIAAAGVFAYINFGSDKAGENTSATVQSPDTV